MVSSRISGKRWKEDTPTAILDEEATALLEDEATGILDEDEATGLLTETYDEETTLLELKTVSASNTQTRDDG